MSRPRPRRLNAKNGVEYEEEDEEEDEEDVGEEDDDPEAEGEEEDEEEDDVDDLPAKATAKASAAQDVDGEEDEEDEVAAGGRRGGRLMAVPPHTSDSDARHAPLLSPGPVGGCFSHLSISLQPGLLETERKRCMCE